jgi:hypothetical protein
MKLKLFFLVSLLFHLSLSKIQYLVPSLTQPRKFSKILLPFGNKNFFDAEMYNYYVFVAPTSFIISQSGIIDLCSIRDEVKVLQPNLWNDTQITNQCERYFCSATKPHFLALNHNESIPMKERVDAYSTHLSILRLCTLCETNFTQNFEQIRLNTTMCPWFDSTCEDYCTPRSTCIYYRREYHLCYLPSRDLFFAKDDFTHEYLFWIYYSIGPYFFVLFSGVFLILDLIFLVIPQTLFFIKYLRSNRPCKSKLRVLFNLKNFVRIIVVLFHLTTFIATFIDSINLISLRFYVISNVFGASISLMAFNLMIVEWSHVLTELENLHAMSISWKNL